MAQRPYPNDREENGVQHSFQQFVARAQQLYAQMQEPDLLPDEERHASKQFLQFTLTGRMDFNDMPHHATLNACQDLYDPGRYQITRDYDSLIGATKDLPYNTHLALSPVPPYRDVLSKPNHIKALAYIQVSIESAIIITSILNCCVTLGSANFGSNAYNTQLCIWEGCNQIRSASLSSSHVWFE